MASSAADVNSRDGEMAQLFEASESQFALLSYILIRLEKAEKAGSKAAVMDELRRLQKTLRARQLAVRGELFRLRVPED